MNDVNILYVSLSLHTKYDFILGFGSNIFVWVLSRFTFEIIFLRSSVESVYTSFFISFYNTVIEFFIPWSTLFISEIFPVYF